MNGCLSFTAELVNKQQLPASIKIAYCTCMPKVATAPQQQVQEAVQLILDRTKFSVSQAMPSFKVGSLSTQPLLSHQQHAFYCGESPPVTAVPLGQGFSAAACN